MKILMINSVCGVGSTGRICTDIAEKLTQLGHECKIAYGRGNVPNHLEKYAIKIGTKFGTYLHGIISRVLDNTGFGSKFATKKFIKWVKLYDPDIIHLHNLHGYYINVEVLFNYLKSCNKKVFWTLHDCWSFTGHCAHFGISKCSKWQTQCLNCSSLKHYPKSLFLDNSKNNYLKKKKLFTSVEGLTVITPSKWLADLVSKSFLKKYQVNVINNGIDTSVFTQKYSDIHSKYNIPNNKKIILGVSNFWDSTKGLNDFLELSKIISDEYIITLIGHYPNNLNKDNYPNICFIEQTDSITSLVEIYSSAYVLFNPTYEDNYPTVNLEAQACGTPVITYKTGGSPESVPSENVVEQGDLSSVLDMIVNKKLEVSKMDFSKEFNFKKYIELYELM